MIILTLTDIFANFYLNFKHLINFAGMNFAMLFTSEDSRQPRWLLEQHIETVYVKTILFNSCVLNKLIKLLPVMNILKLYSTYARWLYHSISEDTNDLSNNTSKIQSTQSPLALLHTGFLTECLKIISLVSCVELLVL